MNIQQITIGFAVLSQALWAQGTAPMVVDADWLSAHLKDKDLVLLHVGPKPEYDTKHIPGARHITLQDVARPMNRESKDLTLELPAPEVLRAKLETFGISDDSRIVLYLGTEGTFQSATRVVFTLDYLGLAGRASILNGGLPGWERAGKPVTADVPAAATGKLLARPTKALVADADFVKGLKQKPAYKLVDARAPVYYNGTEPTYEKNGHIPGAINIPFSQITDSAMNVDREHVAEVFRAAGIKPGDTVVAYCHIGQQATAVIFGARLLGNPVMLYDGSFQDWSTNNRGPVEK